MSNFMFGTAINCIDGRTQQVVIDYMKRKFEVDGVDMVNFPGVDGIFANGEYSEELALIKRATSISIERHGSKVIAVVGHHDCASNPGDKEYHYAHIRKAVQEVHSWKFPVQVIGLYVDDEWKIEEVR